MPFWSATLKSTVEGDPIVTLLMVMASEVAAPRATGPGGPDGPVAPAGPVLPLPPQAASSVTTPIAVSHEIPRACSPGFALIMDSLFAWSPSLVGRFNAAKLSELGTQCFDADHKLHTGLIDLGQYPVVASG